MSTGNKLTQAASALIIAGAVTLAGCAGGPLTTREKAAGIGALGGAAVGGHSR